MTQGQLAVVLALASTIPFTGACTGAPSAPGPVSVPAPTPTSTSLRITGLAASMAVGTTATPQVAIVMSDGSARVCSAAWTVDDTSVAQVSTTGQVTTGAAGYAKLTASCEGLSGTHDLRVDAPIPGGLRMYAQDSLLSHDVGENTRVEFLDGELAGETRLLKDIWGTKLTRWPLRLRVSADWYRPIEVVLSESTGRRIGMNAVIFDFYWPMEFVGAPDADNHLADFTSQHKALTYPVVMNAEGPIEVATWWALDINDTMDVSVWCGGVQIAAVTQRIHSAGSGLTAQAPAGACEVRLRNSPGTRQTARVAIRYRR